MVKSRRASQTEKKSSRQRHLVAKFNDFDAALAQKQYLMMLDGMREPLQIRRRSDGFYIMERKEV